MTIDEKYALIKKRAPVALLAPTFVIDFKYPAIIGMLKKLGFSQVTELTFGAQMVNWAYAEYVKAHPDQKLFISSPCPNVVAFIKAQRPDLVKYLVPVVSPMVAMARYMKKEHPDLAVVFISPCFAKENLEAPGYKGCIDAVLPLKQLKELFERDGIKENSFIGQIYEFDSLVNEDTKIYPVSGGLASTSHLGDLFKEGEVLVTDGIMNIKKALEGIDAGTAKYRFLDLLNCPGGCIGGPAICSRELATDDRRRIVLEFTKRAKEKPTGRHSEGITDFASVSLDATEYLK